ncbi:MAG: hypothetical protein ACJ72L_14160 [Marmoricola sp.]
MTFEQLQGLAATMVYKTDENDVVFIDASFARIASPRSYAIVDDFISILLSQAPVLDASCQIVVSLDTLPIEVDNIYDLLSYHQLSGRLAIVEEDLNHLGDTDLGRLIAKGLKAQPIAVGSIDSTLLRRRGVFRSASEGRQTLHNLFYYEASGNAVDEFSDRLAEALRDTKPDLVVFDASTSGPWFSSAVAAACVTVQTESRQELTLVELAQWIEYGKGELQEPERSRAAQAKAVLSGEDTTVAIIVPGFLTGRSLTRVIELIGSPDIDRCTTVAVFADASKELQSAGLPGTSGIAVCEYRNNEIDVHCMHQVPLRTIPQGDWLVKVAEVLGEIRDLPVATMERLKLDRVALWSLFDERGVSVELLPAGSRAPKKYFPDLRELDRWDAHWIAQCAVENILANQPGGRGALLVVIPEEENGTLPISNALLHGCGVAVLQVPRKVIDRDLPVPQEIRDKLTHHQAETIVVFDESTVTYGTLERLVDLVEAETNYSPALVGTFLDLSSEPPKFEVPYFALASWAAVAEGMSA